MADEISINFVANVREVIQGTDQISDALGNTERDLDKVGDAGEKSLDKVVKGTKDAKDGAGGLAGSVSGELVNSFQNFDGTAAGALESVSGGLSSLAALIPGVGGLIGAGIGTALTEGIRLFTADLDAQAKASEDRIKTMYESFIESGNNFYTEDQIRKATQAITGDPDKVAQATKDAETLGVTVAEVIAAEVEAGAPRNALLQRSRDLQGEILTLTGDAQSKELGRFLALQKIEGKLKDLTTEQGGAGKAADLYRDSLNISLGTQTKTNEQIQIQNRLLAETPKTIGVKLNVDTSAIDSAVRRRTVQVDIETYTRSGTRVY